MKVFLLDWLSTIFFWGAAFYFCFIGTEVGLKYWKRKLVVGVPFFLLFVFLVQAFGVPRYFVYDHVEPKVIEGKAYYPAVKNHLIFQGPAFKEYGVINQDLTEFQKNESYFNAFSVAPLEDYPSVQGIKRWANELILLAYFVLWLLLLNKMQNASAASALYKNARKMGRLEGYQAYLDASHPIRFLQPIRRHNAKRHFSEIRQVYIQSLHRILNSLSLGANEQSAAFISYISQKLEESINPWPSINVEGKIDDITTSQDAALHESGVDLKRDHYKPSDTDLSEALSNSLTRTLNLFLPEAFLQQESDPHDATIALSCPLTMRAQMQCELKDSNKKITLVAVAGKEEPDSIRPVLPLSKVISPFPAKIYQHGQDKNIKLCANTLAQLVVNDALFTNTKMVDISNEDEKALQDELAHIKARQIPLFDAILREYKTTAKGALLAESINAAIKHNEAQFDSLVADLHQLIGENTNLYADFVAQEVVSGLHEGLVEVVSE
ncbi:hypothetical protein [Alteromonas sp. 14N.309.X.WAT.G.H12]|uniref:hypothetical protein n=1 Tax=Alteromonas sp. 14N.309.X.WAT.G.H12 TaxID=3120824 RepID=UPI002FCF85F8